MSPTEVARIQGQIEAERKALTEKKNLAEDDKKKVERELEKREKEVRKAQYDLFACLNGAHIIIWYRSTHKTRVIIMKELIRFYSFYCPIFKIRKASDKISVLPIFQRIKNMQLIYDAV